ncbi:nuclear transport factor 2 family protein [Xanthomonas campestris pv. raphani]|uniref:nuclear transport factor 2 family protein n=1 Tax=Xanthomonas campestris TaxID=339 RepID=UPI002B227BFA|nr:nuclear transport factor 2 family protein [Xanthomonas campestris]MEA9829581.1 nuclear transport factor 2 family protein [Xanthomonas campestris pv. raphani]
MRSSILRWHVGLVAFCVLVLAGCAKPGPEQRLRATVEQMRAAIEARDVREAMAPVAEDFVGEHGMDAAGARRLLQLQLLGHQAIGVTFGPVDVQMQGSTATVRFSVLLTGGGGRWLPDQAQHYQVTTGWRLRGSDWELYHAQWTAGGG